MPEEAANKAKKKCFVVMGFGEKVDFQTGRKLNLDAVYFGIIKPAAEEAGLECYRADEIIAAGHDAEMVYDLLNRVESPANEFKRRQLPPTLIISKNAIGIGRRRPVTHRFRRHPATAEERAGVTRA